VHQWCTFMGWLKSPIFMGCWKPLWIMQLTRTASCRGVSRGRSPRGARGHTHLHERPRLQPHRPPGTLSRICTLPPAFTWAHSVQRRPQRPKKKTPEWLCFSRTV